MKDLQLRSRAVIRTSSSNISSRHLADCVNKLHQKACRTSCTIYILNSTNQIIDLWCCRSRSRRRFSNSLLLREHAVNGLVEAPLKEIRKFKIYDATVAKTSIKIASSSFSIYFAIRELKHATFLSHGRQPEVNNSHARAVVFPRFSN